MLTCGIYHIVNKVNGKRYVGSSVDIESRLYEHFRVLALHKHHCIALQRAYNKYGRDSFAGTIIQECKQEDLLKMEQEQIDEKSEYNSSRTAGSPLGTKHTDCTRRKYSERMATEWARDKATGTGHADPERLRRRGKSISETKRAARNYNEDPTIYEFWHPDHGTKLMTQKEFHRGMGVSRVSVNHLIKGRQKTYLGWRLKEKAPEGA